MQELCIFLKDSDRSIASALLTLAGLFPPNGNQIWNEHINWQPIPVHTTPMALDHVLAVRKPCDRLNYIMIKYANSTEYSAIFDEYRTIIDALRTYSGWKIETLHEILFAHGIFLIEIARGFR